MTDELDTPALPEEGGERRNTTLIIIGVVVLILLCCCCSSLVLAWNYGDAVIETLEDLSLQFFAAWV